MSQPQPALTAARRHRRPARIAALLATALLPLSATAAQADPGTPSAVLDLAAAPQDAAVELSFDAPDSDGGTAISSYEYSTDNGGHWDTLTTTPGSPITATVGGLTNGVQSVFWVRARNPGGAGETAGPVAATPRTVPGAPELTSATGGDGEITAEWTAPASDGGGDITGYDLVATPTGSGSAVTGAADPTDTSATINPVPNGKTYDVQVAAVNDAGRGAWSDPVQASPVAPDATVTGKQLPARIHVGSAQLAIPVAVTLDHPRTSVEIALLRPLTSLAVIKGSPAETVGQTTITRTSAGTTFSGTLQAATTQVKAWGAHQWRVEPQGPSQTKWATASVRAHSLLGLSVKRQGEWVMVTGSARAYHSVLDVYKPWNARPVELQRWNGEDWTTIKNFTTDQHGNLAATVRLPWKAGLRLTTPDTATIWGATTASISR